MEYLYIWYCVVIDEIDIAIAVGYRMTDLVLHVGVVICLSWHRVIVVVGDILDWLQGSTSGLWSPWIEARLVVLCRGVVGGGCVHIGQVVRAGVVTVVILALVIPRDHMVRIAIGIVLYWSPSKLLCLTQLPSLSDALESLINTSIWIITNLHTFMNGC